MISSSIFASSKAAAALVISIIWIRKTSSSIRSCTISWTPLCIPSNSSLPASTWKIIEKFSNLDLSDLDSLMTDLYSIFGPPPRLPSDILRSILLPKNAKNLSVTAWKRASGTANVTDSTASLTATSDGIPIVSVTIFVMTCICSPPLIQKTTCLSSFP